MNPIKPTISLILLTIGLLTSACIPGSFITNTQAEFNSMYYLSKQQAISIATENSEVKEWINQHAFVEADAWLIGEYWEIWLDTKYNENSDLDKHRLFVYISDSSGKILDINYAFETTRFGYDTFESAVAYFLNQNISEEFTENEFSFNARWNTNNFVKITGSNASGNSMEVRLAYNFKNESELNFELLKIKSGMIFGNVSKSFHQIEDQILNLPDVIDFQEVYPDNSIDLNIVYYTDSKYLTHNPGYYFEAQLTTRQNNLLLKNGVDSTYQQLGSAIVFPIYEIDNIIIEFDKTGNLVNIDGTFFRNHTTQELSELALADEEISNWLEVQPKFSGSFTYGYNSIYKLYIDDPKNGESANILINDSSGQLIKKSIDTYVPAKHTENELYNQVSSLPEVMEWAENIDYVQPQFQYDNRGGWKLYLVDPTIAENFADFRINDISGSISLSYLSTIDTLPTMDTSALRSAIQNSGLGDFYALYPDARVSYYYHNDKFWTVFVFSEAYVTSFVKLRFEDASGELQDKTETVTYSNTKHNREEIENFVRSNETYFELVNQSRIVYNYTHYLNGMWRHYIEAIDESNRYEVIVIAVSDETSEIVSKGHSYLTPDQINRGLEILRNDALGTIYLSNMGGLAGVYDLLGKFYSIPLSDILGPLDTYNTDNLHGKDDDGGLWTITNLSIFILSTALLITIIYQFKKKRV